LASSWQAATQMVRSTRLWIKNIRYIPDAELKRAFSAYGEVFDFLRNDDGHSALVSLSPPECVESALDGLSGRVIFTPEGRRVVRLSLAKRLPSEPNPELYVGGSGEGLPWGAPAAAAAAPLPPTAPGSGEGLPWGAPAAAAAAPLPPTAPVAAIYAPEGCLLASALQVDLARRGVLAVVQGPDAHFPHSLPPPYLTPALATAWGLRYVLAIASGGAEGASVLVTLTPEAEAAWARAPLPPPLGPTAAALRALRGARMVGLRLQSAEVFELLRLCEGEVAAAAAAGGASTAAQLSRGGGSSGGGSASSGGGGGSTWSGWGGCGGAAAAATPPPPPPQSETLFLLGVADSTTEDEVVAAFTRLGMEDARSMGGRLGDALALREVRLPTRPSDGKKRGFAIVNFCGSPAASLARARSGGVLALHGRDVKVAFDWEKAPDTRKGARGGGGVWCAPEPSHYRSVDQRAEREGQLERQRMHSDRAVHRGRPDGGGGGWWRGRSRSRSPRAHAPQDRRRSRSRSPRARSRSPRARSRSPRAHAPQDRRRLRSRSPRARVPQDRRRSRSRSRSAGATKRKRVLARVAAVGAPAEGAPAASAVDAGAGTEEDTDGDSGEAAKAARAMLPPRGARDGGS
jgi:hypothetical protein